MTRLYRRLEELLELIKLAETTALKRIATTDGMSYDLSTGEGVHQAVGAINNAVLESRKISDRTRRKQAVDRGIACVTVDYDALRGLDKADERLF